MKIKVLLFTPYFFPGFKGGGPIKSIKNLIEKISDEYEFWIVTSDRDLNDITPYKDITVDKWNAVGQANVFYVSPEKLTILNFMGIIKDSRCEVIYLNSFFSLNFSIKILIACKFVFYSGINSIIIAPRGEFSSGALKIKAFRKKVFIFLARFTGLYKNILWQATSNIEKEDITYNFNLKKGTIFLVKNLPSTVNVDLKEKCLSDVLKIIFLSRISPKKNLEYALRAMRKVVVEVQFDIYGPKEDMEYWVLCQSLLDELPNNIKVSYCGLVEPENVSSTFSMYDLFFFPTLGENYGHVIAESLSVGTSVLLSDQTPWRNLENDSLGWDYALSDEITFVKVIESISRLSIEEKISLRKKVIENSYKRIYNPADVEANRALFLTAAKTE